MEKFSQKELLEEGFLDSVRRAGGIARAAVKGAAKGIYSMDPEGFNKIAAPVKTLAAPIVGAYNQIKQDDPVSFLKEELKAKKSIELVKVVSQKTQNADTSTWKSHNRTTSTQIKNLFGISKTVTIITFWGTTYRQGTERQYRTYGEANELTIPNRQLALRKNEIGSVRQNDQLGPVRQGDKMRQTKGRVVDLPATINKTATDQKQLTYKPEQQSQDTEQQDTLQPPVPGAKLMAAEVFRTNQGLVMGDVYDPKTGDVISAYTEKQEPFSFENAKTNFFANHTPPLSPNTTELTPTDATEFIKYLYQLKRKDFNTASSTDKNVFNALLSSGNNVAVNDIKKAAKQVQIAENTNTSQKVLLEQLKNLL
jgi:hypothetical protein